MNAPAPVAIDDFDRHILSRVQRDAHCKAEAIASEIGLSASAVQRRLKRLRERGVIRAEVAVLDPAAVGGLLTLLCGMAIERENYAALADLRRRLAEEPMVQQAWYVTGEVDLVAVVLATFFLHGMKMRELGAAVKESTGVLLGAGFVLLFTVPMVRILINSGVNGAELASMPITMARYVADSVGGIYPLLAPSVGALGAFIAGSNTVSNMMLAQFQFGVAQNLGISTALIVAVQAIGAAAGNMVAIHNVVAASATVGLLGREGTTLRKTVWPTLYYVLFTGLIALLAIYALGISDPLLAR